jgi:2-polyprenyl-3-methyl-5-hydroxy-6-metoxy-1,4-benzoquinol methylase
MEKTICEYCKSPKASVLYGASELKGTGNTGVSVLKCRRCGLVYTAPALSREELLPFYTEEYYGINSMKFKGIIEKLIHIKRGIRAGRIARLKKPGKILDIGCGRGIFLDKMRKKGWETYGTEISETGARHAREVLKLNVFTGAAEESKFADNFFDCVTLFHVLEHLPHPVDTLKEARRMLKPGGLLVVAVPNIQSWQAKLFRTAWFHLDVPRHSFHFSLGWLKNIFLEEGWDIARIKRFSFEHGPFGWVQSLLNTLSPGNDLLYDILKEETTGTLKSYARRRFRIFRWSTVLLNLLAGAALTVPSVALSMCASLTDYCEVFEMYCLKK